MAKPQSSSGPQIAETKEACRVDRGGAQSFVSCYSVRVDGTTLSKRPGETRSQNSRHFGVAQLTDSGPETAKLPPISKLKIDHRLHSLHFSSCRMICSYAPR